MSLQLDRIAAALICESELNYERRPRIWSSHSSVRYDEELEPEDVLEENAIISSDGAEIVPAIANGEGINLSIYGRVIFDAKAVGGDGPPSA